VPIRTNRGRAAVYRRLWGWPMRSPRHLIVTLVLIFAVVTTIGVTVPRLTGSGTTGATADLSGTASSTTTARPGTSPGQAGATGAAGQAGGQASGPPSTSLGNRITSPSLTPTSAKAAPEALDMATRWATAWANHPAGRTHEQWINDLRPLSTDEEIIALGSVALENIPATAVTGPAVPTNSTTSSVEATVPTNGGQLSITVISTPQGWRVANYTKAG
jgi:hypothetical protein